MNHNEPFVAAVFECESVTRTHGHTLGKWQQVTEEMYVSMCVVCNELTWVTQQLGEKRWRIGGSALEKDCLEEDWGSASEV
jgi:hypothetical protein